MNDRRFTAIEYVIVLAMCLSIILSTLLIVYRPQLDQWWESLGPWKYLLNILATAALLNHYWQLSTEQARMHGQPVIRSGVWVAAAAGIVLACVAILSA